VIWQEDTDMGKLSLALACVPVVGVFLAQYLC